MKLVANFKGIFEYIPFVFCDLSLSPLKADVNGNTGWFAAERITQNEPAEKVGYRRIWFRDCNDQLIMKISEHFIHQQQRDAFISDFSKKIAIQISLSTNCDPQIPCNQQLLKEAAKDLIEFQLYARKCDVQKALQIIGYEANEDGVASIAKILIGK